MKIKMYGGALTISYNIAKFLNEKGVDVTLYIDSEISVPSYRIEWEDDEFKNGYPSWIRRTEARLSRIAVMGKREKSFLDELSDCDLLHMHGEGAIWASFTNRPYVYHSYGYDLDQLPFKSDSIKAVFLAHLARRALKKSSFIIIAPHQAAFADRLGVGAKSKYVPYPIDCGKYKKIETSLRAEILKGRPHEFIFFHPTRHQWLGRQTNNKGNDKLIRAFKIFCSRSNRKALLLMVEKGQDLADSKRLCRDLDIEKDVMWVKESDKKSLIELYSISDVMLDQFTLGSFGLIALESMSCGLPTFTYTKGYDACYDEPPPVISAYTEDDIAEKLLDLTGDVRRLSELGDKSRRWVVKYHDKSPGVMRYMDIYNSILERQCIHT